MNPYIQLQIINMCATVRNCQQDCHWAAEKDDGVVSKEESRVLKKIDAAVAKFTRELERLK